MTATEQAIEEVREARRRMSAECGHDVHRLVERLKEFNERYAVEVRRFRESPRLQGAPESPPG